MLHKIMLSVAVLIAMAIGGASRADAHGCYHGYRGGGYYGGHPGYRGAYYGGPRYYGGPGYYGGSGFSYYQGSGHRGGYSGFGVSIGF